MFAPLLEKKSRWYWRVTQVLGLTLLAVALTASCFFAQWAHYYLVDKAATPLQVYHNTWRAVRDNLHDQEKLAQWAEWEHKFDDRIKTHEDAVFYARQMVDSLRDPYTFVMDPHETRRSWDGARGTFIGIGVEFAFRTDADGAPVTTRDGRMLPAVDAQGDPMVKNVLRGSPAQKAGLRRGDSVVSIDGKPAGALSIEELSARLQGERGSTVTIVVRRSGSEFTHALTRQDIAVPIVSTAVLDGGVGYLRIEHWAQLDAADQLEQAMADLDSCSTLVLDLRNNPGGLIHTVFDALGLFMEEGRVATEHVRIPGSGYLTYRVEFSPGAMWVSTHGGISIPAPRRKNLSRNRPLVVLVNGNTASAAEIMATALQDTGRAVIIGETSFGKGVGQTFVNVGNGVTLRVTNFRTFTPRGHWVGNAVDIRQGVQPDIAVPGGFDPAMVDQLDDHQLFRAVEYLRSLGP